MIANFCIHSSFSLSNYAQMIDLRRKGALKASDEAPKSPVLLSSAQALYDDWMTISSLPALDQGRARQNLITRIRPWVPIATEASDWRYLSYGLYDF